MINISVSQFPIKKITTTGKSEVDDALAVEEPLEIRLTYGPSDGRVQKSLSVTMRTPGHDRELALGFLFAEGIIKDNRDVVSIQNDERTNGSVVDIELHESIAPALSSLDRHFYTSSSCGVCGKTSLEAVRMALVFPPDIDHIQLSASLLYKLPALLRQRQEIFDQTGGLHASALFNLQGKLVLLREDVGRHNALDKLIGASIIEGCLPLNNHVLLLSGRISFELVQKAAMAGIRIVTAVGAPSSLALSLARENNMTLIGFLRDNRFNIYTGEQRIANEPLV